MKTYNLRNMATGKHSTTTLSNNITDENQHSSKFCPEHKNEGYQMYCARCECLICFDCILGKHRKHEYKKIGNIAKQNKRQIEQVFDRIKSNQIPNLEKSVVSITKMQEHYSQQTDKLMAHITTKGEKLKQEIDKILANLKDELMLQTKKDEKYLQEKKTQIDIQLSLIKRQLDEQEERVQKFSDIDIIVQAASVQNTLSQLTRSNPCIPSVQTPTFESQLDEKDLRKLFGQLLFEKTGNAVKYPSLRARENKKLNYSHQVQVVPTARRTREELGPKQKLQNHEHVGLHGKKNKNKKQNHSQLVPKGRIEKTMGNKGNQVEVIPCSKKVKTEGKYNNIYSSDEIKIKEEKPMDPKVNQSQLDSFHGKEENIDAKYNQRLLDSTMDIETMVTPTQNQDHVNLSESKETAVIPKLDQGNIGVIETTVVPNLNQDHVDTTGGKKTVQYKENQGNMELTGDKETTVANNNNLNQEHLYITGGIKTVGPKPYQTNVDLLGNTEIKVCTKQRYEVQSVRLETTFNDIQNLSHVDYLDGLETTAGFKQYQIHVNGNKTTMGSTLSCSQLDPFGGKIITVRCKKNQDVNDHTEEKVENHKTKPNQEPVNITSETFQSKDAIIVSSFIWQKCLTKMEMLNSKEAWILTSFRHLNLVNDQGKHKTTLTVDFQIFDMALALSGDLLVTISGGHQIKRVTMSGKIGIFADLSSSTTCGIHTTKYGDILVGLIGVMRNGKVTRLSSQGQVLEYNIIRNVDLYGPNRVTENVNKDIVMIDEWKSVVVVDRDGKYRFKYLGETIMKDRTFKPVDIICNQDGDIIIADENNHTLHILKEDGVFLHLIITQKAGLQWPMALAMNGMSNIWVGCKNGQVFLLQN